MLKKTLACLLILALCAVVFCSCIVDPDTDGEPTDTVSDTETESVTTPDSGNNDDGNNDGGNNDGGNNDSGNNDDGNTDDGNNGENEQQKPSEGFAPSEGNDDLAYDENWTPNY